MTAKKILQNDGLKKNNFLTQTGLLVLFLSIASAANAVSPTSTIFFNSNGGTAVASKTQLEGSAVTEPANPTRAGYTFAGWVPAVPGTMPVDDMTCFAQWTAAPSATVMPTNGPYAGGNAILVTNATPAIGNGSDITNVTVGGVAATILGQNTNWVRMVVPVYAGVSVADVLVYSTSRGVTTLTGAYTYNPAGVIGGGAGGRQRWVSSGQETVPGFTNAVGANNTIYGLAYDSATKLLYAAGAFTNIGGTNCFRIAACKAGVWTNLLDGVVKAANVNCVAPGLSGAMYTGGYFTNIGGINTKAVAKWTGTNFVGMGNGLFFSTNINGYVNAICARTNGHVVAVGYFTNADYSTKGLAYAAEWDGTAWTNMEAGFNNVPLATVEDRSGFVYVGGSFTNLNTAGGGRSMTNLNYIAKWTGTAWTNMASGFRNRVTCMAVNPSNELYVGGWFTNAINTAGDSVTMKYVAKWDGNNWTNVGNESFNNWVYTLAFDKHSELYAGGSFTNANGYGANRCEAKRIARWDGVNWTNVAGGVSDTVLALASNPDDDEVIAAGFARVAYNSTGGGDPSNCWYIARWVTEPGPGVFPPSGSVAGGYQVAIAGTNLGSGVDVTNVTLCGVSAASIVSQSATQVVVLAGVGGASVTGDVVVVSTSYGTTVKSNAFTYIAPPKADQTIDFPTIGNKVTTDTVGLSATASSGLPVSFRAASGPASISGGTNLTFSGTGVVSIVASQSGDTSWNAAPDVTNTFTVTKAVAPVSLSNTNQTYDGTAKSVTVTTVPTNLSVVVAYDGSTNLPQAAGAYAVVATIDDVMYQGGATGTLTIASASQTISFPAISDKVTTDTVGLAATASSGLPVSFSVLSGSASISGGTNLTFSGAGSVSIVASQAGNSSYNAAPDVTNTFTVTAATLPPSITAQPVSAVVTNGAAASLSVIAGGTAPLSYQWMKNSAILPGQTNSTLSFSSFQITDSGSYSVVITNEHGMTISLPASLSTPNAPLRGWGLTLAGQLGQTAPAVIKRPVVLASNVVAAAAGETHSFFVKADGTLWGMGCNNYGQLGDGTTNNSILPVSIASNVVAVTGGTNHSLFVKADGTLWAMGRNNLGQLGIGTTTGTNQPVIVTSNVVAVAAGNTHSLFVKADGTLWAMGDNTSRQLGGGIVGTNSWPIQVASNVVAAVGGWTHSLFVKADGTLWAMGNNFSGQLGDFTTTQAKQPIQVASNVVAVAAGYYHSLFAKRDGTLWVTGRNNYGQLGDGTTNNSRVPITVASNVVAVAGGYYHSLFVKSDGTLWGMGYNGAFQLGNGTTISTNRPVLVNNGGLLTAGLARQPLADYSLAIAGALPGVSVSNQTVTAGQATNFTAAVAGDGPFTYQWQFNGTNVVNATNDSYTISSATLSDAGNYDVIVVGAYGTTTSTVAILTVNKADQTITFPAISDKLTTDTVGLSATADSGLPVSFSVLSGSSSISGGTNLTFSGAGSVSIVASQNGGGDWNAAPEVTNTFNVMKAVATVTLSNTNQTYDGTAKSVTVTTVPAGRSVSITYDSSETVPTNAGSYTVVATVNEALYQGGTTGTLTIAKAWQAVVSFPNIGNQITTNVATLSATASSGLSVTNFIVVSGPAVVSGSSVSFTNSGAVMLSAIQNGDVNYNASEGTTNIIFSVTKAVASVSLSNTNQTYDGTAKSVTVTTVPTNLTVTVTYDGSSTVPTNAGNYTIVATVSELMYQGSKSGILIVKKSGQTITFPNIGDQVATNTATLNATSTSGLSVTNFSVVSGPAVVSGSNVTFTSSGPMTLKAAHAGDSNWYATTGTNITFNVTKAVASVSLSNTNQTYDGTAKSVTVTTVPTNLAVVVTYDGSATGPTNAGSCTVVATVNEPLYQGGATGTLTIAKASQTISFPNIGNQVTTNVVTLSATASSGLSVTNFSVISGPAVISGASLSFTNSGSVTLSAIQNGNTNWNASAATNISFSVTKAVALVSLSGTNQTYNGTARVVTATTVPTGRTVEITYNGSSVAPTNAGSYTVIGIVNEAMYQGGTTGTLVIAKADQTVNFPNIGNQLTTNVVTLSATASSGLSVTNFGVVSGPVAVRGNTVSFSAGGTVVLSASQTGNVNWNPASTNISFTVSTVSGLVTYADDAKADDSGDGLSWATAKKTIQAAIDLVGDGGTVWVTNGTYSSGIRVAPGYTATNRICMTDDVTVKSVNGPAATFIDGGGAVRCAYLSAGTLSGFTLTNGMTDRNWGGSGADWIGGGAYLKGGGTLNNCTLSGNTGVLGGGAYLEGGVMLNNCTLIGNTANAGGGAYLFAGGTLNNCTLSGNTGELGGGVSLAPGGTLNNCTLSGNSATFGGGAYLERSDGSLQNCIVWGNTASSGKDIFGARGYYTCASDGVMDGENGCTTNNPLFVSTNDFRLLPGSPCINAGNNSYVTTTNDLDGNPRIAFGTVDMGAYESQIPPVTVPVALSAVDITDSQFTAHWAATDNATNYLIDVSETNTFASFTGVYSNRSAGNVTACLVTGLINGKTYYYRLRGANVYGISTNSNVIAVPVSTNTPYVQYETTNGVVSAGSSDAVDMTKLFHGVGMSYSVVSNSNPALVTPSFMGSKLILDYVPNVSGTACITVRATDNATGFCVETTITVSVAPKPSVTLSPIVLNRQNGLYEQIVAVSNNSPTLAAHAVTLTVTNLSAGARLYNATGTDEHGNPEILWIGTLAPLGSMNFTLQYYTAARGTVPSATVLASLSLDDPQTAISGAAFGLSGRYENIGGTQSFLIEFAAVPGRTYYIQYTSSLSNPWRTVQPGIIAPANRIQWIDSGPPGTECAPGNATNRFYRVIEVQ